MICEECGMRMEVSREPLEADFHGERFEVEGIEHLRCPECGETALGFDESEEYCRKVDEAYRERHGLLAAEEIKSLRKGLRLTQEEFQAMLGVGKTTVCRWETGKVIQPKAEDNLMRGVRDYPEFARALLERSRARQA